MSLTCLIDFPHDKLPSITGRFENPCAVLVAHRLDEIMPLLAKVEEHAKQGRWAIGMLAYEAAPAFDPAFHTQLPCPDLPLAAFAIFDKPSVSLPERSSGSFSCSVWQSDTSHTAFISTIESLRSAIAAGDYYQANFTTRLKAKFAGDKDAFFQALCEAQPESYALLLDFEDWQIASVSPELFFSWDPKSGGLVTRPMKGTGSLSNPAEALQNSAKDRAENLMIVDLLRNDMSRVADKVQVPELFTVKNLSTVRQMTSTITGMTRSKTRLVDVFAALFPCGSVTGAPKIAAMQAIAEYETSRRGAYCGALGIVQPGGEALFSVGIRSVTIKNGKAECGIGSGITWDSVAEDEFAECQIKQRFLWRASASFDLLETMRLDNGTIYLLHRHLTRLKQSADYFGFVLDETVINQNLHHLAEQNPAGVFRLRLLVSKSSKIKTELFPYADTKEPALIRLADKPVDSFDEFLRFKTTNRTVYEAFAPTDPAIFDTLLWNERSEITEFTRGNVAIELDGKFYTPPESCGLLPGTQRAEMLERCEVTERVITRYELNASTNMLFINALRGELEVTFNKPGRK